ncbi:hypothetical protein [Streptomyces viridochromogenes]|uniref:hypothetical protein n=1 Tax=Streptomyces viridochromogenes TaxID=1938 RepID=UPI00069E3AE9|nr:hypothetical protein [Streptomyces viridochromogenes]KOG09673.1 hypothetical protein ADK35_39225 [Streptomyces viridochromogenes]KOG10150.1 hypothetical protein ADK36_39410 [Streptomyces viridochromogenes]
MSKAEHETGPQGTPVCPVCKQPLEMTIKRRHKTLGIFVPVWGPRPCHNPECPEYLEKPELNSPQDL